MKAISTQFTPVSKAYDTDVTSKNIPNISDNQGINSLDFDSLKENLKALEQDEFVFKTNFPIEVFPNKIQHIIKELNRALNFPIDFTGTAIAFAYSISVGNVYDCEIMTGWKEKAIFWFSMVGNAGTAKSHPLSFCIKPILERDAKEYERYRELLEEYKQNEKLKESDKEPLEYPNLKKTTLSDFTPESLSYIHQYNKKGLGVYADELATWFKNFNRYNSGAVVESWLSLWSAKPLSVDRKNESIRLDNPFVGVIGGIQPKVLSSLKGGNNAHNGFIDRILFTFPENLKKSYWSDNELDYNAIQDYKTILTKVLDMDYFGETTTLKFHPKAKQALKEWQRKNTDKANISGETLKGLYSKSEIYVIRFSLLFEVIFWSVDESNLSQISERAVYSAIKIMEYYTTCSERIYKKIYNSFENLSEDKKKMFEDLASEFTTKEALTSAKKFGISERSAKSFLKSSLFKRIKQGTYTKNLD